MSQHTPDFAWYSSKSKSLRLSPRCPIARSELCPRYYGSYWLLGNAGITTKITDADKERLDRKWSVLKPVVSEEEPGISLSSGKFRSAANFCPEVAYDVFGLFASSLWRYANDLDSDLAQEKLGREQANSDDPRWQWSSVAGRHFTECREYSLFGDMTATKTGGRRAGARAGMNAKLRWQVLSRDNFVCTYCGRRPPDVALEVDHRISVVDGGSDDIENLITACVDCNRGKGAESR